MGLHSASGRTQPAEYSGQAGLEPATFGFGDRRSTIRATDLGEAEGLTKAVRLSRRTRQRRIRLEFLGKGLLYLGFLVKGMLAIERAILAELKLSLGILAVLLGSIVLALALTALHGDKLDRRFLGHIKPLPDYGKNC